MVNVLRDLTRHSVLCMFLASIGALLFGIDNGWWGTILGSNTFLRDYGSCNIVAGKEVCNLSTPQISAGSSVQSGGMMIGCLMAAYINNFIGRRWSLVVTALISIFGVIIELTSAVNGARYGQFVAGKVIASVAMGMAVNIVPLYLSETAPASARGLGISLYQSILIVGSVVASGTVFATSVRTTASAYLIPMALQLVPPALMLLVTAFIPESPRWLAWRGRYEEAEVASQKLMGNAGFDAAEYCDKLKLSFEEEKQLSEGTSWGDLLRHPVRRRLAIAVGIQCLQQAQGGAYMNSYLFSFLQGTGVKEPFPIIMGLTCIYWVAVLSGHFLPDMVGRRVLLMTTGSAMGTFLVVIAILTTAISDPNTATQKASIALIFLWNVAAGVQAPVIWITTAESAPTRHREKVLSMATFWGFGVSLLIASVSPYIQNAGYGGLGSRIGFIWGSFSFITVAWVFFLLPEMKGFSLEHLDYLYSHRVATRAFKTYRFADDVLALEKQDEAGPTPDDKGDPWNPAVPSLPVHSLAIR